VIISGNLSLLTIFSPKFRRISASSRDLEALTPAIVRSQPTSLNSEAKQYVAWFRGSLTNCSDDIAWSVSRRKEQMAKTLLTGDLGNALFQEWQSRVPCVRPPVPGIADDLAINRNLL